MAERNLMLIEEVAEYLRISANTVRNMIDRGELPAARIGKQYRIKRVDVDRLLETGEPEQTK
jgi:putative molybdopterin biosynthesis protein